MPRGQTPGVPAGWRGRAAGAGGQQVARIRAPARRDDLRTVTLADGRRLLLEADEVSRLGLVPEGVVDEALGRRLVTLDERTRAREAAVRLLGYRPRSRGELAGRLKRLGFSPDVAEYVIGDLTTRGMLDDAHFARAWAEYRALGRQGPARVRAELRAKGVAPPLIDEAVRAVFSGQEEQLAGEVVEHHLRRLRDLPVEIRVRRLVGLLRRRGFSGTVIAALLRRHAGRASQAPDAEGNAEGNSESA